MSHFSNYLRPHVPAVIYCLILFGATLLPCPLLAEYSHGCSISPISNAPFDTGVTRSIYFTPYDELLGVQQVYPPVIAPTFVGEKMFFIASTKEYGTELWVWDRSAYLSAPVADIYPGPIASYPSAPAPLGNNRVVFTAFDDTHRQALYVSDGTEIGTQFLLDLPNDISHEPIANHLTSIGLKVLFYDNGGRLFVTDGTVVGTHSIPFLSGNRAILGLDNLGPDGLFMVQRYQTAGPILNQLFTEVWRSDGTLSGTSLVSTIAIGAGNYFKSGFHKIKNSLLFFLETSTNLELWSTTSNGTTKLAQFSKLAYQDIVWTDKSSELLVFQVGRSGNYWISDGTVLGTFQLFDELPASSISNLKIGENVLYFNSEISPTTGLTNSNPSMYALDLATGRIIDSRSDYAPHFYLQMEAPTKVAIVNDKILQYRNVPGHTFFEVFRTEYESYDAWLFDGTSEGSFPLYSETLKGDMLRARDYRVLEVGPNSALFLASASKPGDFVMQIVECDHSYTPLKYSAKAWNYLNIAGNQLPLVGSAMKTKTLVKRFGAVGVIEPEFNYTNFASRKRVGKNRGFTPASATTLTRIGRLVGDVIQQLHSEDVRRLLRRNGFSSEAMEAELKRNTGNFMQPSRNIRFRRFRAALQKTLVEVGNSLAEVS